MRKTEFIKTPRHRISPKDSPYLIAEIGLNHNGSLTLAKEMSLAAKSAGAHAVKFQMYRSEYFIEPRASLGEGANGSLLDFFRSFELTESEWKELRNYADSVNMDFLCSVFDKPSLDFYRTLDPFAVKIASGDISNQILIEDAVETGIPILLSTGTAEESEVQKAVSWIPEDYPLLVFQCVSSYPARPEDANLMTIRNWTDTLNPLVGLSDHTSGIHVSAAAVALGACAIERHFTTNKNLEGPDHKISLDPAEFRDMAKVIRTVYGARGDGRKSVRPSEEPARMGGRRSLYTARDLKAGSILAREDLIALRPGGGIPADQYKNITGKKLLSDLPAGTMISRNHIS